MFDGIKNGLSAINMFVKRKYRHGMAGEADENRGRNASEVHSCRRGAASSSGGVLHRHRSRERTRGRGELAGNGLQCSSAEALCA